MTSSDCFIIEAHTYIKALKRLGTHSNRENKRELCIKIADSFLKASKVAEGSDEKSLYKKQARSWVERAKSVTDNTKRPTTGGEDENIRKSCLLVKKPTETFNDIAGLEEAKEIVKTKAKAILYPRVAREAYGIETAGGILLYGPPGTGKTMFARAVANEYDAVFLNVKCSDITHWLFGKSERLISELFASARSYPRAVICLDEVEALIPKSTTSSVMPRLTAQFSTELEGVETSRENGGSIMIIATTNEPWKINERLWRAGRFDKKVYVGLPCTEARKRIFQLNLKGKKIASDIDYDELAALTPNYGGADIREICRRAGEDVFKVWMPGKESKAIEMIDLLNAITKTSRSVTDDQIKKYEAFNRSTQGCGGGGGD